MKPSVVFMIRLCGSVKLRCALSAGVPGGPLPRPPGLSFAAARASASSAALASRILASRCSLLATQAGISSPRRAAPCARSSVRSVWFAAFSQPPTSAAELRLRLDHPAIAHRFVFGGVRLDLGAVERDMAELDQSGFPTQPQHLHKQPLQCRAMALAKIADRAEVGPLQCRHCSKVQPLLAAPRNPSRRVHAQTDRTEDRAHGAARRGDEMPAWVASKEQRLAKIREAKAALEAEARAAANDKPGGRGKGPPGTPAEAARRGS